jgi:hypothetical protein
LNYASFVSCFLATSGTGEKYAILPLIQSILILYLTEAKKQINGVHGQFKASCKVRKAGLSYRIETYPDLIMEK